MKLRLVRVLDFYLGIPLCFLFSILNLLRFGKCFDPMGPVKRILFIELSEMGSTLLAYPAMKELRERFPDAEFSFLIFDRNRQGVDLLGLFGPGCILTIRDHSAAAFIIDNCRLLFRMFKCRYDIVYDFELFSRYSVLLAWLSGARARIGFHRHTAEGLYRGNLLTHRVQYNAYVHMAQNFLALGRATFEDPSRIPMLKQPRPDLTTIVLPRLAFDDAMLTRYRNMLDPMRKTLVVNPYIGSLLPIRQWSEENYARVIHEAIDGLHMNVVVVGLPEASAMAQRIAGYSQVCRGIIDLTRTRTSMRELLHVIQVGDVFLTNDSGPAHFAALTGTPILTLFGPATPDVYSPLSAKSVPVYANYMCSPCLTVYNQRNTSCIDNRCLQAITPEIVLGRIRTLLAQE